MTGRGASAGTVWVRLVAALHRAGTVSTAELSRLVREHTDVSTDYALRRLCRKGVLRRSDPSRRGVWIVAGRKTGRFVPDSVVVAQADNGHGTVFGYGTALYLHGLSRYARLTEFVALSATRRNPRRLSKLVLRFAVAPIPPDEGVTAMARGTVRVIVTDIERTLIDCIHRPKYAQGWENVLHALERVEGLKPEQMIALVKRYRTPSLAAKVGLVLEHYAEKWRVTDRDMRSLRPYLPKSPVKLWRDSRGPLNRAWNLYVPKGLFHG